jgi:hypothetical protein
MAKILTRKGLDITASPNEALDAQNQKIENVANPTNPQDVATKDYVDNSSGTADRAVDNVFRIEDDLDATKKIAFEADAISTATTRTISMPDSDVDLGLVATAIQSSEKGQPNGVASLDGNGKVPLAQLPNSIMEYKGTYDADLNVPALADGAGNADTAIGDVYRVTVAGTQDFGSGNISFEIGDYVILNDSKIWEKAVTSEIVGGVSSVNGQVGDVVLDSADLNHTQATPANWTLASDSSIAAHLDELAARAAAIEAWTTDDLPEGASNLYFTEARVLATLLTGYVSTGTTLAATDSVLQAFQKLDAELELKVTEAEAAAAAPVQSVNGQTGAVVLDTDDVNEGAANLYFTDARAKAAAVADEIVDGVVDVAPSQNAVFDALALKADEADLALAEGRIDTLEADSGASFDAGVAGETFAADEIYLVRRAKNGETAGRYYKAQADSSINSRVVGVVIGSGQIAGDAIRVYKLGEVALGASDTAFLAADINAIVYLSQTVAGKWTLTPTEDSGDFIKEVGFVGNTSLLEFQPGFGFQA